MTDDSPEKPADPIKNIPGLSPAVERIYRQLQAIPKPTWQVIADFHRNSAAAAIAKAYSETGMFTHLQQQSEALRAITAKARDLGQLYGAGSASHALLENVRASREAWSNHFKHAADAQWNGQQLAIWYNQLSSYQRVIAEAFKRGERNERIIAAGWLPHSTIGIGPDEIPEAEGLGERIDQHYRTNWPAIRQELETSLDDMLVDSETQECFREALSAHEAGLHRCAVRTLLPEIERVARVHFKVPVDHNLQPNDRAIGRLKAALGSLPLSALGGVQGEALAILERFLRGVYRNIKSLDEVEAVRLDHVPNRHASIHGIVPYASHQHSVNAIVMTHFVFSMLTEHQHSVIAEEALDLAS